MTPRTRSRIPHVLWTSLPLRKRDWFGQTIYVSPLNEYAICDDSALTETFKLDNTSTIWLELLDQPTPDTQPVTLCLRRSKFLVRVRIGRQSFLLDDEILSWEARQLVERTGSTTFHLRVWIEA